MGYRYIGSKNRIVDTVVGEIAQLAPKDGTVADLMCGTASVSAALRNLGFSVFANDVLTFCYHHAVVNLCFAQAPQFRGAAAFLQNAPDRVQESLFEQTAYERIIAALNNVAPVRGYFWREFSLEGKPANGSNPRNYFSAVNAAKIDGIRKSIHGLRQSGHISEREQILLLHDLVMGANDVANIAGTYGHYLSSIVGRAKDLIALKPTELNLRKDTGKHKATCGYAEDIAGRIACDVCYIDPPYMKRQYAANYHILETLARGDEPEAAGQSGLRPWRDQYSNFCTRTRIQESFGRIFSTMECRHYLVSYSEDGLLSVGELLELFSKYGKVTVKEFKHKRFKSNNSKLAPAITEYILHLAKNGRVAH